jgi:hypothetical protein
MRRFIIIGQLLLVSIFAGAGSTSVGAASTRAPELRVVRGTLRWNSLPGVHGYVLATQVGQHTTYRVVHGTRFTPSLRPGQTVAYMVKARVPGARWSRVVTVSERAGGRAGDTGALKVSVNNTTGWYVDPIFYRAGVRYERLNVGDGSNLSLVADALRDGMTPLVVYNPDSGGGSLHGVSPPAAAAQVLSLAQKLASLAARYPILTKLRAIEFGNEVYIDEGVAQYAAQYDAAHRALAAHGLSSWKLLAAATAVCGKWHAENWIPEFIARMSDGADEVDGWSVHPYGPMNSDASPDCAGPHGFGWPDVRDWHQIAVNHGSTAPWYVTEVGQCISAGYACPHVVDQATQAADLARYLDSAASQPWVVYFNWYASCDDSAGGYGLLAENSARVCGANGAADRRPAFDALGRWLAANGEG